MPKSDEMPRRVKPCLALLVPRPPVGPEWIYEIKWDGYRLAVHLDGDRVRVLTRGGHDWTTRFAHIADEARQLGHKTIILDGEAVVLDEKGRSDFGALQNSLGGRSGSRFAREAVFYAFDLLYLDGRDLKNERLSERRIVLEKLLQKRQGAIRLSETIEADANLLFERACELGLEGIIAKRLDRPYRSGRYGEWQKIKCIQSDSFAIVGYEPSNAMPGAIGRLLLAARRGDELVYVGGVGTGFTNKKARELKTMLDAVPARKPPVAVERKNAIFADPRFVAEIEYRGWTTTLKLRHASFKGLREAEDHKSVMKLPDIESVHNN